MLQERKLSDSYKEKRHQPMKCNLGDIAIFYETYGTGRPIVMLPGRPSDHRVMARFMEPLFTRRDGWMRLYPDLPGTGRTPGLDRLATHDQMLDTVLAFIDTVIPGQRFVLAGLSYGGYLARGVVYRRAASIDGVLLCAPQVKADPAQAQLPPRTTLVEDPTLVAQLDPGIANLVVVQSPGWLRRCAHCWRRSSWPTTPSTRSWRRLVPFPLTWTPCPPPLVAPRSF